MSNPKLRFKREDGTEYSEWRGTSFGETCSGFEYGMNTAACDYDGVNKYIRITDIDDTSRRYLSENAVSPKGNMQDKYIVNPNDILFARTGASVGKAYLYKDTDGLLYYAGFLIRANVNADANAYFVFSQTLTADYWNWVKLTSTRTGQQGINAQEYKGYKFNVPCLEEQQKIADFLSTVDEVIAQSEAEVQNLEQQKKAAMQKIFSQEVRFKREDGTEYPEWVKKKLGDVTFQVINKNKTVMDYPVYSVSNSKGFISQTEQFEDREVASDNKSNYKLVTQYQFAYNPSRINVGSIAYLKEDKTVIVSPLYVVFECDGILPAYLNEFVTTRLFHYQRKINTEGSVRDSLSYDGFSEIILTLPSLEEQQKIADFLSAYDEAIGCAKQELDKWTELKKGLLQQMFV